MVRPSSRIRAEIAKLQEQLKSAETREAERLGRLALRAGLGNLAIDDSELENALAEITRRFQAGAAKLSFRADRRGRGQGSSPIETPDEAPSSQGSDHEA